LLTGYFFLVQQIDIPHHQITASPALKYRYTLHTVYWNIFPSTPNFSHPLYLHLSYSSYSESRTHPGVRKFIQDIAYTRTEQELIDLYIAHYYAYMKHVCSKCKRIRKGYSLWSDTDPQVVYTPVCDRCLTWVGFPPI